MRAFADSKSQEYHVDIWQTDDGLPQSSVTAITQTQDGYLWLGTFGGLARFDGVRFTSQHISNSLALASRRIVSVFEDRSAVLWTGTEEGDLVRFEGGKVEVLTPPNRGTASKHIRAFAQTMDGALWLASAEGQLVRLDRGRFNVVSTNWSLRGTNVTSIWTDNAGVLW